MRCRRHTFRPLEHVICCLQAFPHPLARLNQVADSNMAGVRNNLSYLVINEIVYDGLLPIINSFRRNVLHLSPLRLGDRGAHLLANHKVQWLLQLCTALL